MFKSNHNLNISIVTPGTSRGCYRAGKMALNKLMSHRYRDFHIYCTSWQKQNIAAGCTWSIIALYCIIQQNSQQTKTGPSGVSNLCEMVIIIGVMLHKNDYTFPTVIAHRSVSNPLFVLGWFFAFRSNWHNNNLTEGPLSSLANRCT